MAYMKKTLSITNKGNYTLSKFAKNAMLGSHAKNFRH